MLLKHMISIHWSRTNHGANDILKSGAVFGPALYCVRPMYGAKIAMTVRRRTWAGSILGPAHVYGATLAESPAPYLGRPHIRSGPCTAPRFLEVWRRTWAGSMLGPAHVRRQQFRE